LRIILIFLFLSFLAAIGCTDSKSEELIEGNWHAVKILEDTSHREHLLPEGIHFNFGYPKYSFEGDQNEEGNYYIKNDQLHLIPENEDTERDISILQLTTDSLTLHLIDSLGMRAVQFVRSAN